MLTRFHRLSTGLAALIVIALVLATLSGSQSAQAEGRATRHPAVDAFIEQHPGASVPVILYAADSVQTATHALAEKGATDVRELPLVGAVAGSLAPEYVFDLAADPAVALLTLDAVMLPAGGPAAAQTTSAPTYPESVNATDVWQAGITGDGVTIAVIDSGLAPGKNFTRRLAGSFEMSSVTNSVADENGHGTYVTGIIAARSDDYTGTAPGARVLSLKVAGREGTALASDVIAALQWAVDHKDEYRIRVINLSLTSAIADSYRRDPLSAAVEQAWLHGIVVVTSAGNFGTEDFSVDHAPANDPFVITVGAFDEAGTAAAGDDSLAPWSSRGYTVDGYRKPEVVAPGVNISSTLARGSVLAGQAHRSTGYVTLSGTSAAAAIVSGAVALMLEQEPWLTPDEVKFRLIATSTALDGSAAGRLDSFAAVFSDLAGSANGDADTNELIDPETGDILYDSVLWRSVLWRSVLWRSVETTVLWRH